MDVNFEIEAGGYGEKIAEYASTAISLTGQDTLLNVSSTVEGYALMAGNIVVDSPDYVVNLIFEQIQKLSEDAGILDALQLGIDVANNTIDLAKKGLNFAMSAATVTANIVELSTKLNGTQDPEITCIPSVKESMSIAGASAKEIIVAKYNDAKQQIIDLYNSMICTSNDLAIDNVVASINGILDVIEPLIDPVLQKYTGYTVSEVRYICNTGFKLLDMLKRVNKARREQQAALELQENNISEQIAEAAKDQANAVVNQAKDTANAAINDVKEVGNDIKNQALATGSNIANNAKKSWEKLSEDYSPEETKEKLLEWVNSQSIILQNAFHLLVIKDTIDEIKLTCQKLLNSSIENLVDFLNALQNVFHFFELLGLTPDAVGITKDDLIALGIATVGTVQNTAKNISDLIQQNVYDIANTGSSMINNATETFNNVAALSIENAGNVALNTMTIANDVTSNAINTVNSASENITNNVNNNLSELQNNALDVFTENTGYTGEKFIFEQYIEDKTIIVDMKIYVDPYVINDDINKFLASFKSEGKLIFNNGNKRYIKNSIQDAWDSETDNQIEVSAKINKITKKYIFEISVNNELYKEYLQTLNTNAVSSSIISSVTSTTLISTNSISTDSLTESITSTSGTVMNGTTSLASNTTNSLNQVSKTLTNVDITIDASAIEAVLAGKVMMFDIVILILKVFQPIIKILKILAHLLENYKINQMTVKNKAHKDLAETFKKAALTVRGLKDIINLNDTNFFTIRTQEMLDWSKLTFEPQIKEDGTFIINILLTTLLNTYLSLHAINPLLPLDLLKGTTMYIDIDSINSNEYTDGSLVGLDNIEVNTELNEIYYDVQHRSTFSSEILRAISNNEDPNYPIEIESEESDPIKNFLKSLEVKSDEFEGTQSINFNELNLCNTETLLVDEEPEPMKIIVEFGDEYTMGEKVDYSLNVKPGDSINDDTILAYIHKDGETIAVRSQYSSGTVKSTSDGLDFYHVYPKTCKNHIILEDTSFGIGSDFNSEDVSIFSQRMSDSGELYSLIMNNMCYSTLPIILAKCNRNSNKHESAGNYMNYVEDYISIVETYSDKIKEESSDDKVKSTNGDPNSIKLIGENILDLRNQMYNDICNHYNVKLYNVINETTGNEAFTDCICLAYGSNNDVKNASIGTAKYNNYYVTLLANTNAQSTNQFTIRYIKLLKDIINTRIQTESYDLLELVREFNTLYKKTINSNASNPYKDLFDLFHNNIDYSTIYNYLKREIVYNVSSSEAKNNYNTLNAIENEEIKNEKLSIWYDELEKQYKETKNYDYAKLYGVCSQLTNIFLYIINESPDRIPTSVAEISKEQLIINAQKVYNGIIIDYNKNDLRFNNTTYSPENYYKLGIDIYTYYYDMYYEDINSSNKRIKSLDSNLPHLKPSVKSKYYETLQSLIDDISNEHLNYLYNISVSLFNFEKNKNNTNLNSDNNLINTNIDNTRNDNNADNNVIADEATLTYIKNRIAFELVREEASKLKNFWDEMILLYDSQYNMNVIQKDLEDYIKNLNRTAEWPSKLDITISNSPYLLYTFVNRNVEKAEMPEINLGETDMESLDIPNPEINYDDIRDINEPKEGDITIFDYEYWAVYMANATLFTLLPIYWADGFDVPPVMTPTLLPAIYFPIAKPVYIKPLNLLIVFGLAIRGIWPMPIILMINMNSHDINAMTPVMIAVEMTKKAFQYGLLLIENGIPTLVDKLMNQMTEENANMKKKLDKFRTYSSIIKSIPIENKALIEEEFMAAVYDSKEELKNKKRDKRQVITREEDLGNGPEPL